MQEFPKRHQLAPVEGSNFVVVDLPKYVVAEFSAERFEFIDRIEVKQVFVYVAEVSGDSARQAKSVVMVNNFVWFKLLELLNILETWQVCRVADDVDNFGDSAVKFGAVDVLVTIVSRVVTAGKIYGSNPKFGSDNRNVGERTLRSFEAFAGNVSLEIGISTAVKNGVVFSFAVKFDEEFEVINFFRELKLLMSEREFFSSKSTDFLVASE